VREAGIQTKAEYQFAHDLLRRSEIQAEIKRSRPAFGDLHFRLAEESIATLRAMANADITQLYDADGNLLDPQEWPADLKLLVSGIEIEERMQGEGDGAEMVRTKKVKLESRRA